MKTLPNGIEIPDADVYIWAAYNYRCVAHPRRYAVCLHEHPPKSLNPHWAEDAENRYPVCLDCHEYLHSIGIDAATHFLTQNRQRHFPQAERSILDHDGR